MPNPFSAMTDARRIQTRSGLVKKMRSRTLPARKTFVVTMVWRLLQRSANTPATGPSATMGTTSAAKARPVSRAE